MKRNLKAILSLAGLMTLGIISLASAGEWYETVKLYGDLRFRYEDITSESNSLVYAYRDRERVRARIGVQAALDDYWMADFRLATDEAASAGANSGGDPISTNQTLGDIETRKPIWVDLAYIQYKFLFNNGKLTAGKIKNPFERVGDSQLIWDSDLTPEGLGGNVNYEVMQDVNLFLNGGGFWVKESSTGYDPMIYGAQLGTKAKLFDVKLTAGFGYFLYTDITNQAPYDWKVASPLSGMGNTIVNNKYINNYMLGEGFVDCTLNLFDFPVKVYTDYVLNNGAGNYLNRGVYNRAYLVGLTFNKAAKEGSWELGYNLRQIQKDAVIGFLYLQPAEGPFFLFHEMDTDIIAEVVEDLRWKKSL
ncbi:MAG: hypothetical protein HGA76_10505, partial [Candidatus Firestonebacteria bacterium]|nr:hypothetical protein [Candidatus Firestonebacteria bacterium]